MLCGGIARDRPRAWRRGGLRRDRLSGQCQKAETKSAEAQGARGKCKTHGYFLKRRIQL
jgi:hypothetical protein